MFKGQATGHNVPEEFQALVRPHVESYDYFIGEGMHVVVEGLEPIEVHATPSPYNSYPSVGSQRSCSCFFQKKMIPTGFCCY